MICFIKLDYLLISMVDNLISLNALIINLDEIELISLDDLLIILNELFE